MLPREEEGAVVKTPSEMSSDARSAVTPDAMESVGGPQSISSLHRSIAQRFPYLVQKEQTGFQ